MRYLAPLPSRVRARHLVVAPAIALAALAASAVIPTSKPAAAVTRDLKIPAAGALFGTWIQTPDQRQSTVEAAYDNFETMIGRRLAIAHAFYGFQGVFPTYREPMHIAAGRTVLISWQGTSDTPGIVGGKYDATITARAQGLKNLGVPVFLRYAWEADGGSNPDRPPSPESYVAAWRHVHDIFEAQGANNVIWVWTGTAYGFKTGVAPKYYPGAAYVDWVGADGYNWAPDKPGATWQSFHDIYAAFYAWGSNAGKPMMAPEFGVLEDPSQPTRKKQWFLDMLTTLKGWPQFKAVVYFNSIANSYDNPLAKYKFIVQSSANATAGYKTAGLDKYFNPSGTTSPPPSTTTTIKAGTTTTAPKATTTTVRSGSTTTAAATAPIAMTWRAHDITASSVFLGGTVECTGSGTTSWFVLTAGATKITTPAKAVSCNGDRVWTPVSVSGLQPHTTYTYVIKAQNSAGTSVGATRTFTTAG